MRKRGEDLRENLVPVMKKLINKERLDLRYRPHKLSGNWSDHWECHIKNDWLLIGHINKEKDRLIFVRTGTHTDLFE